MDGCARELQLLVPSVCLKLFVSCVGTSQFSFFQCSITKAHISSVLCINLLLIPPTIPIKEKMDLIVLISLDVVNEYIKTDSVVAHFVGNLLRLYQQLCSLFRTSSVL